MSTEPHHAPITGDSVVVAIKDNVSCALDGETVILNASEGIYYGLDPVGTFIWGLIEQPRSLNAIRDAILEEYDVDAGRCEADLVALIGDLASNRLVEVK